MNTHTKIGLSVVETGWLLQKTEAQVRGMLRRRELSYSVEGRLVAIDDVEQLLGSGLAVGCLRWLVRGLITAPRPAKRWGSPASLFDGFDALMLARPALVVDTASGTTKIVPELGSAITPQSDGTVLSLKPVLSLI